MSPRQQQEHVGENQLMRGMSSWILGEFGVWFNIFLADFGRMEWEADEVSNEMEQKVRPIWGSSNRLIDTRRRRRRVRWLENRGDLLLLVPMPSKVMARGDFGLASPEH
ncbi:hypothetical protein WISP_37090 [Willisornis vidua]|uniref:Uncharacterized protein n=1 Tax=Willisornis vidua TaxID=1566151 RepID=A0ABQ9DIU4_9PASS|nr:hypothetical protein WISP_37090 [Willisornis vidua]